MTPTPIRPISFERETQTFEINEKLDRVGSVDFILERLAKESLSQMGMDFLDVTFRIEKTFGIPFDADDFHELVRERDIIVGDLYDLILKKMDLRDRVRYDIRLNYALWKELQSVIHTATNVPLDQVQLNSPLASLFPRKTRRVTWEALQAACPYRIRELEYPLVAGWVGFSLAAVMAIAEQLQIWRLFGARWLWPLLGLFGIWILVETYIRMRTVLRFVRYRFPSGMNTVKDLCRSVLYDDVCQDAEIPSTASCQDIWRILTEILVDTLGVDADQVTFRSRLINDLGME